MGRQAGGEGGNKMAAENEEGRAGRRQEEGLSVAEVAITGMFEKLFSCQAEEGKPAKQHKGRRRLGGCLWPCKT